MGLFSCLATLPDNKNFWEDRRMGKEFKKRDNYVIKMGKELVPVTREVYEEYHRMERRERYLVERDQDNSLIFFSTLRAEDSSTDVPIRDSGVDVEEEVIKQMFLDKLPKALALLSDDEIEMIRDLYWNDISIRELARKTDTAKSTLLNKRDRVLAKLRKILENE
jgi:DNA-directed RNA polymerase specialized sigma subunit, sigma24 homolog